MLIDEIVLPISFVTVRFPTFAVIVEMLLVVACPENSCDVLIAVVDTFPIAALLPTYKFPIVLRWFATVSVLLAKRRFVSALAALLLLAVRTRVVDQFAMVVNPGPVGPVLPVAPVWPVAPV